MTALEALFERQCERIAELSSRLGRRVDVGTLEVLDRQGHLPLKPPGRISPNGACRMVRAADGWLAVNLAREEDRDLIPAWLGGGFEEEPWDLVERSAPSQPCSALLAGAELLGLPVAAVGEAASPSSDAPAIQMGPAAPRPAGRPLKVVDLSALWAGPLSGAIFAAMGASVTKVESVRRPDPTRTATPAFFRRLNGAKTDTAIDFQDPAQLGWLREEVGSADVVIASARPRAFHGLGIAPEEMLARTPGPVWVAVTGYGWRGPGRNRVAFGDDAAAAGGLVRPAEGGEPHFLGDALADPLTGLAATIAALDALSRGGGVLVDASMAHVAAGAAADLHLRRAA